MKRSNIDKCRNLRKNQTDAENKLWRRLQNRQFAGVKFRRQFPIGKYIIDFYCPESRLGIEVDGGRHYQDNGAQQNAVRTKELSDSKIQIIRFSNLDVLSNIEGVCEEILDRLPPHLNPLPVGERKTQAPAPSSDKPEEACGVFGVYAPKEDVARLTYFGLQTLQHRGQESAGIAVGDGKSIFVVKDMGLVPQVFDEKSLAGLHGRVALGHVRYSTTGSTRWENAQPIHKTFGEGTLALAHNGNLINSKHLKEMLQRNGSYFNSTSDTEVIADLIASFVDGSIEKAIVQTMNLLEGAYSVALITEENLYAFRDAQGIRPLCIGKLKENYIVSSETCGLDIVGAKYVDDVQPGELVMASKSGLKRRQVLEKKPALCIFEFIYFARPDSFLLKQNLYACRKKMGAFLAEEAPVKADLVIGVPDSGVPAAIGFAEKSNLPYGEGLIKNRYIGRTFIQPSQTIREVGIKMKLNPLASVIKDKKIVVVDDSIVRGNTTKKIIGLLRSAGAKEVHVRVSSPPYKFPCFYGIDTATAAELIANKNSVEKIRKRIKADSLHYLSLKSLIKATSCTESQFCDACLTGNYPVKIPEELKISKLMLERAEKLKT